MQSLSEWPYNWIATPDTGTDVHPRDTTACPVPSKEPTHVLPSLKTHPRRCTSP